MTLDRNQPLYSYWSCHFMTVNGTLLAPGTAIYGKRVVCVHLLFPSKFWSSSVHPVTEATVAESWGCLTRSVGRESFLDAWFKLCPMSFFSVSKLSSGKQSQDTYVSAQFQNTESASSLCLLRDGFPRHGHLSKCTNLQAKATKNLDALTRRENIHEQGGQSMGFYDLTRELRCDKGKETRLWLHQIIWPDTWCFTFLLMKCRWLGSPLITLVLGTCLALRALLDLMLDQELTLGASKVL